LASAAAQPSRFSGRSDRHSGTCGIPEVTDFSGSIQGRFFRPAKQQVTLRIDADVLAWFRAQGGKY
jgi:uncharacterized protein (DUF4415 family)